MPQDPTPLLSNTESPFPRLVIHDGKGCYWDGSAWVNESGKAQLYAGKPQAFEVVSELYWNLASKKAVCQTFQAPFQISVHSNEGIDLKTLVDWLHQTVELSINRDECGCGPSGSVVIMNVMMGEITECTS